jgi:hypothetical protein
MPADLFARLRTLGDLAPDDEEEDVPNSELAGSKVMAGKYSHIRFCSVAVHSEDFRSSRNDPVMRYGQSWAQRLCILSATDVISLPSLK